VASVRPSPILTNADCLDYDPGAVTADGLQLVVGQEILATFADAAGAREALSVARHYHRYCVIGRFGRFGRSGQDDLTVTYWG
jgi:hypothetical protein